MEHMNKIDFTVKLTGSQLFDMHSYVTAKHLCTLFPPLNFTYDDNEIRIYGELNDAWYEQWCRAMFSIGETPEL